MPILSTRAQQLSRKQSKMQERALLTLPPGQHLYGRRNPAFKQTKPETHHHPKMLYVGINVAPDTNIYTDLKMYKTGDLVLYSGPVVCDNTRKSAERFVPGHVYAVEYDYIRRFTLKGDDCILLRPHELQQASKNIPLVSLKHIRHVSKSVELERIRLADEQKLVEDLGTVLSRTLGMPKHTVVGISPSEALAIDQQIYILQAHWYAPELVTQICEKIAPNWIPSVVIREPQFRNAVFSILWAQDVTALIDSKCNG